MRASRATKQPATIPRPKEERPGEEAALRVAGWTRGKGGKRASMRTFTSTGENKKHKDKKKIEVST